MFKAGDGCTMLLKPEPVELVQRGTTQVEINSIIGSDDAPGWKGDSRAQDLRFIRLDVFKRKS